LPNFLQLETLDITSFHVHFVTQNTKTQLIQLSLVYRTSCNT